MPDIEFVFDRTVEDVYLASRLREKIINQGIDSLTDDEREVWGQDLKGCRNASDLNRIGNAINIIGNMINEDFNAKTDWENKDIPTINEMTALLDKVTFLREKYQPYISTIPVVPPKPINSIEKMNDVEKILYDVYNVINIISTDIQLCGESYACNDNRLI